MINLVLFEDVLLVLLLFLVYQFFLFLCKSFVFSIFIFYCHDKTFISSFVFSIVQAIFILFLYSYTFETSNCKLILLLNSFLLSV